MVSLTRSMATLVTLPFFLPILVAAIPAPEPMITAPATLERRANGANIIGFSLSGTSWRTRSCNNGFFSTVGDVGNCCVDSECDFITTCIGSYIYYDSGSSSECDNVCGTGSIFKTVGDQSPLSMFNCQSDWTVTETVTSESDTSTTLPSILTTTEEGSTVTVSNTADDSESTESVTGAAATATSATREVTLTVLNSDGSRSTSVSTGAPAASGTSPASADTSSDDPEPTTTSSSSSNAGAIAGGVVGGVAVLAIIAGIVAFFLWKKKKNEAAAAAAAAGPATPGPNGMGPPQGPYSPAMQENSGWQQNNNAYGYSQVPQQPGVYPPTQQDYKMPLAGGGYADAPQGPQMIGGTPINYGPQELAGAQVHAPVEMPSQPYGR